MLWCVICDTVVSIYSAYCLLLLYGFVLLCLIWRLRKTKPLKYLYLRVCVCLCMWKKEKCFSDKRMIKLKFERKTSNAQYYIISCVCVLVYTILLFCSRPTISLALSLCAQQRVCLCGFYVLSVLAYIYILWSLRVFVSIRRRIFPDYFICVCISVCFK